MKSEKQKIWNHLSHWLLYPCLILALHVIIYAIVFSSKGYLIYMSLLNRKTQLIEEVKYLQDYEIRLKKQVQFYRKDNTSTLSSLTWRDTSRYPVAVLKITQNTKANPYLYNKKKRDISLYRQIYVVLGSLVNIVVIALFYNKHQKQS